MPVKNETQPASRIFFGTRPPRDKLSLDVGSALHDRARARDTRRKTKTLNKQPPISGQHLPFAFSLIYSFFYFLFFHCFTRRTGGREGWFASSERARKYKKKMKRRNKKITATTGSCFLGSEVSREIILYSVEYRTYPWERETGMRPQVFCLGGAHVRAGAASCETMKKIMKIIIKISSGAARPERNRDLPARYRCLAASFPHPLNSWHEYSRRIKAPSLYLGRIGHSHIYIHVLVSLCRGWIIQHTRNRSRGGS